MLVARISCGSAQEISLIFRIWFWTFLSSHLTSSLSAASGPFSLVPSCWKVFHPELCLRSCPLRERRSLAELSVATTLSPPPSQRSCLNLLLLFMLDLLSLHPADLTPLPTHIGTTLVHLVARKSVLFLCSYTTWARRNWVSLFICAAALMVMLCEWE